jgi:hypothetical protein
LRSAIAPVVEPLEYQQSHRYNRNGCGHSQGKAQETLPLLELVTRGFAAIPGSIGCNP